MTTSLSPKEALEARKSALMVEIDAAGDAAGDAHSALDELDIIEDQLRALLSGPGSCPPTTTSH